MYAAGVTCTDCHNPHSATLRAGPNPNDTCAACHLQTVFATASHAAERTGDCVSCHMAATTYMGVDDRRDHSFRIPGAGDDPDHYGPLIRAARAGDANEELLAAIAGEPFPAIVQATLLTLLEPVANESQANIVLRQLDNGDPLVRIAALRNLRRQRDALRLESGSQLLRDPVRAVRVEAALTYVDVRDLLPVHDARAFPAAAEEYRRSMQLAASMPDAALNLAEFEGRLGNSSAAASLYEHALRVGPNFAPAQHAYGLHLVRSGRADESLAYLQRATELAPDEARFVYVYGVALNSLGRSGQALLTMRGAWENSRTTAMSVTHWQQCCETAPRSTRLRAWPHNWSNNSPTLPMHRHCYATCNRTSGRRRRRRCRSAPPFRY